MLPEKYKKRSFLKFDVGIEHERLLDDYSVLSDADWMSSYWGNIHCSVGMMLLRGGSTGTEKDFYSDTSVDYPVLDKLPYIKSLISEDGPFGGAKFAFMFKMVPFGITISHQDLREQWFDLYRIHVPVITNDSAMMISERRSVHYDTGFAWTFDNQKMHGVVNGGQERVHLIFDVAFNDKMQSLIDSAEFIGGEVRDEINTKISNTSRSIASYPGDDAVSDIVRQMKTTGHDYIAIAEHLNKSNVPTRVYGEKWDSGEVARLVPAIFK